MSVSSAPVHPNPSPPPAETIWNPPLLMLVQEPLFTNIKRVRYIKHEYSYSSVVNVKGARQ